MGRGQGASAPQCGFWVAVGLPRRKGSRWEPVGKSKMDEGLSTPYPQGKSLEGVRTLGGHQQLCAPRSRAGAAW